MQPLAGLNRQIFLHMDISPIKKRSGLEIDVLKMKRERAGCKGYNLQVFQNTSLHPSGDLKKKEEEKK